MIYPEFFPEDRTDELAEYHVFKRLKELSEEYDIFYARKFVTDGLGKKPEFEVDFIIAKPMEAIACIEVKGGMISYDGARDCWYQNGHKMETRPEKQAQDNAHGLANTYSDQIAGMPVGWAVCFPDCQLQDYNVLPSLLTRHQVVDQLASMHFERMLPDLFRFIKHQHPERSGISAGKYQAFKTKLLRGLGFVQLLSTRIQQEEARFIELTQYQLDLFKRAADNPNILVSGPAGSGKTILAKTLAKDHLEAGKEVLFLCFNRILANHIKTEFGLAIRNEANASAFAKASADKKEKGKGQKAKESREITVETFHQFARDVIDAVDPPWWNTNVANPEFWDLEVPIKLGESLESYGGRFDVLIIDEGQDFKEYWFETLFRLIQEDGKKLIFLDRMQDIFERYTDIPGKDTFFRYSLPENCRNTQKIVEYLSELTDSSLKCFKNAPRGEKVEIITCKNQTEAQRFILDKIKTLTKTQEINPGQILLLLNSKIESSSLARVKKIGPHPLQAIGPDGIMQGGNINYSNIQSFKGLEADIVFVVDIDLIPKDKLKKRLYTEVSRGRHRVYVIKI